MLAAIVAVIALSAARAAAQDVKNYTLTTLEQWLSKYADAKPDFKPGEVLGSKDLERIRPFVPPGWFEQLDFPQFKMEIMAARSHMPRKDYQECTEKYQAQVKLNPDGSLANYVCGQPFPNASLSTSDPLSGIKAAWNFDYRWQNYGEFSLNYLFIFAGFGGSHAGEAPKALESPPSNWVGGVEYHSKLPSNATRFFGGGGSFSRIMSSFYRRVYFSHLAQRADNHGLLGTPDSAEFLWKEFTGFFSPYDVRGQVFITYRYADPHRADDAWAYDPQSRRVRRVSVEVKSDSVAGSDTTQEDFYTFSGRELHWHWKFLGWKYLLAVMDSRNDYAYLFGPNGEIPNDRWSLRRFAVIERTPIEAHHPYSSVVMFWDAEDWFPWMSMAFNRQGKLWKLWELQDRWSEDFKSFAEINHGVQAPMLIGESVVDVQNKRATIFTGYGNGYPNAVPANVTSLYDISKLEEMHR
ncbi:MAG TPA: DUF1329 domain-containing protein [Candidatus Binataceae bacterium]|nr:DUF1329 domain-containing protein [Candidatus Binataceae bacterium]